MFLKVEFSLKTHLKVLESKIVEHVALDHAPFNTECAPLIKDCAGVYKVKTLKINNSVQLRTHPYLDYPDSQAAP